MTLLLTELSHLGIAMATDSAVTYTDPQTGASWAVPSAAKKLHPITYLNAGVSCWGLGRIGQLSTDEWLVAFVTKMVGTQNLSDFARELAVQLNREVGPNSNGAERAGFHVAGYLDDGSGPAPSLFHVHDGPSTALAARGITIDPHVFNANHDSPPSLTRARVQRGEALIWRNGDYKLYAELFTRLEDFFLSLRPYGILVPQSSHLLDRVEYLIFQIRTVAEIYRQSNLVPGIGGEIPFLAIGSSGIHTQGVRFV